MCVQCPTCHSKRSERIIYFPYLAIDKLFFPSKKEQAPNAQRSRSPLKLPITKYEGATPRGGVRGFPINELSENDTRFSLQRLSRYQAVVQVGDLVWGVHFFRLYFRQFTSRTVIGAPTLIFNANARAVAPPDVFLFIQVRRTRHISVTNVRRADRPFPLFQGRTTIHHVTCQIVGVGQFITSVMIPTWSRFQAQFL